MIFYSHSKTDLQGNTIGSKTLESHIKGVLQNALNAKAKNLDFGLTPENLNKLVKIVVLFHDFGKFTTYFQNYLLKKPVDGQLKQHARVGGISAFNLLKEEDEKLALICLYAIFRHHTQLSDIKQFSEVFNQNLEQIFKEQTNVLKNYLNEIEEILGIDELEKYLYYPNERNIRRSFKIWALRESDIRDYFLVNYVFSLLIESDKLDASDTIQHVIQEIDEKVVDIRFSQPNYNKENDINKLTNNELRNFCRAEVVSNILNDNILEQFIFTLTAPTGIGKTMTALDFALKLKKKINDNKGIKATIIYALPFINIIEQALHEYEITLPNHVKVIGHYQLADVFGSEKESIDNGGAIQNYNQKLMSLDTWQSDVVITSFVQFFETLIGNSNKLLKKFNHYANSIIILDEVQTLRLDQMPLIGASLFYLSKYLNSRIILMTATKPKIFELAQQEILSKENEIVQPLELLKSHKKVFSLFKRTKIVSLLTYQFSEDVENDFLNDIFIKKWDRSKSCLIVCNTVNRSIKLFNSIRKYLNESGLDNPVEYLSTNIIPAHRKSRIEKLKREIIRGTAPILISTQVVEAGVDLDFNMGFRDLGPIDSIVQVAGRINRNNSINRGHSPLFVVNFNDSVKIYGQITTAQAIKALSYKNEFLEEEYLSLIDHYFDNISNRRSFLRFNKIFTSMKHLLYDSLELDKDRPVSSFKIIEESHTTSTLFIELDEEATVLKEKYEKTLSGEISKEEFDEKYKLKFQQRIISIPNYLTNSLKEINEYENNLLIVNNSEIHQYYDQKTGFIRTQQKQPIVCML